MSAVGGRSTGDREIAGRWATRCNAGRAKWNIFYQRAGERQDAKAAIGGGINTNIANAQSD